MSELETQLRRLAANGELNYLSVVPVSGKGGTNGVIFNAQVTPASRFGYSEGRDADPVKALLAAIDSLPKSFVKEKPKSKRPTQDELQEAFHDRAEVGYRVTSAPYARIAEWDITS